MKGYHKEDGDQLFTISYGLEQEKVGGSSI